MFLTIRDKTADWPHACVYVRLGDAVIARPACFVYVRDDAIGWVEPSYLADVMSMPAAHSFGGPVVEEGEGYRIGPAGAPSVRVVSWQDPDVPADVFSDLANFQQLAEQQKLDLGAERERARRQVVGLN